MMNNTASTLLRDRVADFQTSYIRCIDRDELERWPDYFVPDCLYRVTTAENARDGLAASLIYANNQAMLRDRISALRHANVYERHGYRHMVSLPYIVSTTAQQAEVETPFMVARIMHDGVTELFLTGVYQDVFVDVEGALRLQSRVVLCDTSRIDTLLAIPL